MRKPKNSRLGECSPKLVWLKYDSTNLHKKIEDVKRIVIGRLRELLDFNTGIKERESAAYSLGTLTGLELKVLANAPKPPDPSEM